MEIRTNSERRLNCLGTNRVHFDVATPPAIEAAYRKLSAAGHGQQYNVLCVPLAMPARACQLTPNIHGGESSNPLSSAKPLIVESNGGSCLSSMQLNREGEYATVQVLGRRMPKWSALVAALIAAVLCLLAIKTIFLNKPPTMRFIIPKDFRGRIKFVRSSRGLVPTVSDGTTTFVIPKSGELKVAGELPYTQWSLTEALWSNGERIPNGIDSPKKLPGDTGIYFWSSVGDSLATWCFVGTQDEYFEWLKHGQLEE